MWCNYARRARLHPDKNEERSRCSICSCRAVGNSVTTANANPISSLGNYRAPTVLVYRKDFETFPVAPRLSRPLITEDPGARRDTRGRKGKKINK